MTGRPAANEYGAYYDTYIRLVPDGDLAALMAQQIGETAATYRGISEAQSRFRYQPDKWSIKQVLGHVCDAERVFAFRAMAFARGEAQPLPGFEQNDYVAAADFDRRPWSSLVDEIVAIRAATVILFRGLSDEALLRRGVASNLEVSVRALGYIIAGHERHHLDGLDRLYFAAPDYPAA